MGSSDIANDAESDSPFATACVRGFSRLRRVAAGMGFGASDADDILQDVYIEACQRPGQYRGAPEAERWLLRVTINRCLLEYRRRSRFKRTADEILRRRQSRGSEGPSSDDALLTRCEEIELVRVGLREMDGSLAAVLVLRYFCEQNATEIGEILELPAATVRSRLRAARMELADRLVRKGVTS